VPTSVLLGYTRLYDKSDRFRSPYNDPRHFPFYYYLGQGVKPRTVIQVGAYLGLPGHCFLKSCKTVKEWVVVGQNNTFITRNLRLYCATAMCVRWNSNIFDGRKYDMAFLSQPVEEYFDRLLFLWDHLGGEGLLVADYISTTSAFHEFCRVKNRKPMFFDTRYGVGIVRK
jgi:hypothetical protein